MNPKDVLDLAKELESEAGAQREIDRIPDELLQRQAGVEVGAPAGSKVKRIGSGIASNIVEQRYDLHTTTPRITANSPDKQADKSKEEIEAAIAGCWMLAPGEVDVWLDQVYDVDVFGRGWSFICHDPRKYGGRKMKEDDDPSEYLKERKGEKVQRFPIIWRHVDCRNVLCTYDERGGPDEVVEKLQLRAREARRAYGIDTGKKGDRDFIDIYRYGDAKQVMTVAMTGEKVEPVYARNPWEHGLGVNPYLLARGRRRAPGNLFRGALYHPQDLIAAADAMLSDAHFNAQLATRAAMVAETTEDTPVDPTSAVPVRLEPEKITPLPPGVKLHTIDAPRTNVDVFQLHNIYTSMTYQNNISAALAGVTASGQSGALFNSAVQIAQRAHTPDGTLLEAAAVGAAVRFLRAIACMKDGVLIYYTAADGKVWQLEVDAKKVEGWDRNLQATIEFGIPFNQNSQAELARLLTQGTPENPPLVNRQDAMTEYLKMANAGANEKRIRIDMLTNMLLEPAFQIAVANFMRGMGDVPTGLEAEIGTLPPAVQQAVMMRQQKTAQATGSNGGGQLARTSANGLREGVAPGPYDTGIDTPMVNG